MVERLRDTAGCREIHRLKPLFIVRLQPFLFQTIRRIILQETGGLERRKLSTSFLPMFQSEVGMRSV